MNRTLLIINLLLLNVIWLGNANAQQTEFYNNPGATYRQAVELFDQQAYSPAKEAFDRLLAKELLEQELEKENAAYYSTVCAVELGDKDALYRVESFAAKYPESKWLPAISFDLGKIYFDKRKYSHIVLNRVEEEEEKEDLDDLLGGWLDPMMKISPPFRWVRHRISGIPGLSIFPGR